MVDQHIIFPLISHNYVYCYNMTKLFEPYHLNHTGTRIPDPPFPLFPHLVPPAIMVWILVWKYIFEPFIHILQYFVLQLSRSTNFCF
jgi:hypothetical protein